MCVALCDASILYSGHPHMSVAPALCEMFLFIPYGSMLPGVKHAVKCIVIGNHIPPCHTSFFSPAPF